MTVFLFFFKLKLGTLKQGTDLAFQALCGYDYSVYIIFLFELIGIDMAFEIPLP